MNVEFTDSSRKQLKKIDKYNRNKILKYLLKIRQAGEGIGTKPERIPAMQSWRLSHYMQH